MSLELIGRTHITTLYQCSDCESVGKHHVMSSHDGIICRHCFKFSPFLEQPSEPFRAPPAVEIEVYEFRAPV